jgi:hypothetical protein
MKSLTVALAFSCLPLARAQEPPSSFTKRPLDAIATTTAPVIDGDMKDDCWKAAAKAAIFVDRTTNAIVADQTIAYITYDKDYIYVAFYCKDSEPGKIEARETIRDSKYANLPNDGTSPNHEDNVTFTLDTYLGNKSSDQSVFSVNALGTPSAQISGGRGGKLEWKGNWESASKRVADGWTCEMRIPWAMLNYPSTRKPTKMGIDFFRYQYRTKLESCWSNITNHGFAELQGIWMGVQPPQAAFKPKLSLLPYVLPGVKDERPTFRAGVDARLTVTPDLTAVGSLNPDFGTIEGAVEGIAFSRAERFVPDRRPFFTEGAGFFSATTRFNDIGSFLYSRRIPTFDLGTKLYGKLSPVDSVGVLNTVTFEKRMDTAIRYHRDLGGTNDAGILLVNKSSFDDHNSVAVLDQHSKTGNFLFESEFAKTWGPAAGGGAMVLSSNYQQGNNTSQIQYHTISNDFRVADGFIPYKGYRGIYGFTDFNSQWRHGAWRSYDYGSYLIGWDHLDQSRYQRAFGFFGNLTSKEDWSSSLSLDYALVDGTIDETVTLGLTSGVSNRFKKFGVQIQAGRLASQPATFISPSASVRLFHHLDLAYAGSILNLQGVTRQHILTASYDLSPTRSFGGRAVMQDNDLNWYLSYRNSGGKGTNLYFIIGDPNARRFSRQAQLKLVFSF